MKKQKSFAYLFVLTGLLVLKKLQILMKRCWLSCHWRELQELPVAWRTLKLKRLHSNQCRISENSTHSLDITINGWLQEAQYPWLNENALFGDMLMCARLCFQLCFYLWGEWHKQQAFYFIQLWLHSDTQWWAVDNSGGSRRSFPKFPPGISPTPVLHPPLPAIPRWWSQGRCWGRGGHGACFRESFEALLLFRSYTGASFFLGFCRFLDQHQFTQGMVSPHAGDIWVSCTGGLGHYRLQNQSGLLCSRHGSRASVALCAVKHKNFIGTKQVKFWIYWFYLNTLIQEGTACGK